MTNRGIGLGERLENPNWTVVVFSGKSDTSIEGNAWIMGAAASAIDSSLDSEVKGAVIKEFQVR